MALVVPLVVPLVAPLVIIVMVPVPPFIVRTTGARTRHGHGRSRPWRRCRAIPPGTIGVVPVLSLRRRAFEPRSLGMSGLWRRPRRAASGVAVLQIVLDLIRGVMPVPSTVPVAPAALVQGEGHGRTFHDQAWRTVVIGVAWIDVTRIVVIRSSTRIGRLAVSVAGFRRRYDATSKARQQRRQCKSTLHCS
jgi:hypothetical protein